MRPHVQKLPLAEESSFVAKTFRTPEFEVGWHQHIEYELILFTEGAGISFIGNHVGDFETGDIYFLGSNLPHSFQKYEPSLITAAVVVQFRGDFLGDNLLRLPEFRDVRNLFAHSASGLKIKGKAKKDLASIIKAMEHAPSFRRLLLLGECLDILTDTPDLITVSSQEIKQYNPKDAACIERVFQFTMQSFRKPISLKQVAEIACMSIPAFCNYFKKSTRKTYVDFLNEIKISYACTLLMDTQRSVQDICFDAGYNTLANFHKQFLKIRGLSPLQYRHLFTIGKKI